MCTVPIMLKINILEINKIYYVISKKNMEEVY